MTYIIAEIGVNHDGSLTRAEELIERAAEAGADCVKFQLFEHLGEESIAHLSLSAQAIYHTRFYAADNGIDWLCTPFTIEDAITLDAMHERRIKLSSRAIHEPELLAFAAKMRCEVILSTARATWDDVVAACDIVHPAVLLQCTGTYPAPPEETNLLVMDDYRKLATRVGLSCHTPDIDIPKAAVAREADVVEVHFTYDPTAPGPDHAASITQDQLANLVSGARTIEAALGDGVKRVTASERGES